MGWDESGMDRGLATAISMFVVMLAIGALLFILFDPAISQLFTTTRGQTDSQQAIDQINKAESIWDLILYAVVFISVIFLIVRSVLEQRRPG